MLNMTRDDLRASSHRSCILKRRKCSQLLESLFCTISNICDLPQVFFHLIWRFGLSIKYAMMYIVNSSQQTSKSGIKRISSGARKSHVIQNYKEPVIRTSNKQLRAQTKPEYQPKEHLKDPRLRKIGQRDDSTGS